jgi:hypothetical protein
MEDHNPTYVIMTVWKRHCNESTAPHFTHLWIENNIVFLCECGCTVHTSHNPFLPNLPTIPVVPTNDTADAEDKSHEWHIKPRLPREPALVGALPEKAYRKTRKQTPHHNEA